MVILIRYNEVEQDVVFASAATGNRYCNEIDMEGKRRLAILECTMEAGTFHTYCPYPRNAEIVSPSLDRTVLQICPTLRNQVTLDRDVG